MQDGLYFRHLSAWLAVFSRAQIEVVLYDDIRRAQAAVFGKVCGHLGIEQPGASALLDQRIKNKNAVMLPPLARRVLAPLKGASNPGARTPRSASPAR